MVPPSRGSAHTHMHTCTRAHMHAYAHTRHTRVRPCTQVRVDFPPHLKVSTPTPTMISIFGIDKQQVGLAAQRVRLLRKPDPYKGKGIRYVGEVVRLKQGKRR